MDELFNRKKSVALIKAKSQLLAKTSQALEISNKLISQSNTQKIIDFFIKNEDMFFKFISQNALLNEEIIAMLADKIVWDTSKYFFCKKSD